MEDFENKVLTKRNVISFLLVGILVLAIPFATKLVQIREMLFSRAASTEITFTGDNVDCSAGDDKCIAKSDTVEVEFYSPLGDPGSPPGNTNTNPTPSPTTSPNAVDSNLPIGYETYGQAFSTTCQNISGWTCDLDSKDTQLQVDIWDMGTTDSNDDNTYLGNVIANRTDIHPEQAVKDACGGSTVAHGYSWTIPASLKDSKNHNIGAFGLNINSAGQRSTVLGTPMLRSGPAVVNCTP